MTASSWPRTRSAGATAGRSSNPTTRPTPGASCACSAAGTHELWTGVCLWRQPDGLQLAWQEMSRVHMKAMTDAELDDYIRTRQWVGCSGAYAIREDGDPLLTVEGSVTNVVGLPMESLARYLPLIAGCEASHRGIHSRLLRLVGPGPLGIDLATERRSVRAE